MVADSKQTLICAYLSGVLLAGLALNSAFGWWWADALAALAIGAFAVREGLPLNPSIPIATGGITRRTSPVAVGRGQVA